MKNLKVYLVEYASGMFRCNNRQNTDVCSNKELKEGEFIVVEHKDCGIFIGKVISDESEDFLESEINDIEYSYVKHIDLKDYFENINKQKKPQKPITHIPITENSRKCKTNLCTKDVIR